MRNKIVGIVGAVLLIFLVWYFFFKPYDYLVSITSKTIPGAINQSIKLWGKTNKNTVSIQQKDFFNISQHMVINDSVDQYQWKIIPVNDSTTRINIYIKDEDHSVMNKLSIPFYDTDFEKRTKATILNFNNTLKEHIMGFKVSIVDSIQQLPNTYCAYIPLKTSQLGKARGMMENYPILGTVLANAKVELNGKPFIEVTEWNREVDSIAYNFCYPIIKSDSLPNNEIIKYKEFKGFTALKAIYNGNYITSDRAWYTLLDYAAKNGYKVKEEPVEVFFSNPNFGGNELEWLAEVYLPIEQ